MSVIPSSVSVAAADQKIAGRSLMDFVPWVTPAYSKPLHLTALVVELQSIRDGAVARVVAAAPPQHAKTETVVRWVAQMLWLFPTLRFSYSSYAQRRCRSFSRKVRDMVLQLGVRLATGAKNLDEWATLEGGGLIAAACPRGQLTGYGIDIAIVDDPYKNRKDAESVAYNEALHDWLNEVLITRGHARTSVIVFATRWSPKDLSGQLIADGWKYINMPALSKSGEPLWPKRWTREQLEAIRAKYQKRSAYTWDSLWQGNPRPRGATLFTGTPGTYAELPKLYDASFGVDLAYSTKTSADSSAVVKLMRCRSTGLIYVADVRVRRVSTRRFKKLCRNLHRKEAAAPWLWYAATSELGAADLFNEEPRSVPLVGRLASEKGDKRTRALAFADLWNAGQVLVPAKAPWLEDFLTNLYDFTGAEGGTDDDVDAAIAAFDALGDSAEAVAEVSPKGKRPPRGSLYASGM